VTLFIIFVTWVSMVLVWNSRHNQTVTLILMASVFANVFVVSLQASGTLIQTSRLCFALGFFQQLTACSMLSWYCLSTCHFAAMLLTTGKYKRFTFGEAWPWYLFAGFAFPLVDCLIVLGLLPLNLSFGIMYPWRYCWIRTESSIQVLAISFYLPALLVITFNLVVSICISGHILRLRKARGKIDHETVKAVVALFFSTNLGTCGFGLLGLFIFLSQNANTSLTISAFILVIMSVSLFVQAICYWLVYFCRRGVVEMWGLLLTCNIQAFRDLQRKNATVDEVTKRHSSRASQRNSVESSQSDKVISSTNSARNLMVLASSSLASVEL
jgi:hypothetical protein